MASSSKQSGGWALNNQQVTVPPRPQMLGGVGQGASSATCAVCPGYSDVPGPHTCPQASEFLGLCDHCPVGEQRVGAAHSLPSGTCTLRLRNPGPRVSMWKAERAPGVFKRGMMTWNRESGRASQMIPNGRVGVSRQRAKGWVS